MKITLCGSIAFYDKMLKIKRKLEKLEHQIDLPPLKVKDKKGKLISVKQYYSQRKTETDDESWVWDRKAEAMRWHFQKIEWSEAILVLNYTKNNILHYIGANTLIEMGLAFYLNKKIFLLNPIPEITYKEEILGMKPIVIEGDLEKIK